MTSKAKRRKPLLFIALLVVVALSFASLSTTLLWQTAEKFTDHKPGLWGEPAWYIFLIFASLAFVVGLLVNGTLWILKGNNESACKRHATLLIGLAAVRGLLYGAILPPWQSPDEHAHFEYAALMSELRRVPTLDDLSPELQQRIVTSMFENDFWRFIKRQPVSSPPAGFIIQSGITREPPNHLIDNRYLYYPQVGDDPPLYYLAPAILYSLFPRADTALQLYVMRLATTVMWIGLTGAVIWGTRRLLHSDPFLAIGAPTFVAFHPMLAHIGSVLNNDVLAALATTLLLIVLMETIRSNLNWQRGLLIGGLLIVEILTKKNGFWATLLVGGMALVWGCRHYRWVRYIAFSICLVAAGYLVLFLIPTARARYWSFDTSVWKATTTRAAAFDGVHALRVTGEISREGSLIQQILPQVTLDLRGHMISLKAKVRAGETPCDGALAIVALDEPRWEARVDFRADSTWQDVMLRLDMPANAVHLQVALIAAPGAVIYFDQITIADLSRPDLPVEGLQNGSGESTSTVGEIITLQIGKRLGLERTLLRFFSLWRENVRKLWRDPWPIRLAFESFWGNFGAALVVPLPPVVYQVLKCACALSLLGLGIYAYRVISGRGGAPERWQRLSLWLLAFALIMMLLQAFAPLLAMYGLWVPQGRYLFPVIWPISVFLILGWYQLMPERVQLWLPAILITGMLALDCTALHAITSYFYNI